MTGLCVSQRLWETWLLVTCGTMRTTTGPTNTFHWMGLACRNPFDAVAAAFEFVSFSYLIIKNFTLFFFVA